MDWDGEPAILLMFMKLNNVLKSLMAILIPLLLGGAGVGGVVYVRYIEGFAADLAERLPGGDNRPEGGTETNEPITGMMLKTAADPGV